MITNDQAIAMIVALGAAVLVGSGIKARRLGGRNAVALALIWIGIIGFVWGAVVIADHYTYVLHKIYYRDKI